MAVDRLTGNSPETDRFWRPMGLWARRTKIAGAVHAHSSTRDARDPVRAGPNLMLLTTETVASEVGFFPVIELWSQADNRKVVVQADWLRKAEAQTQQ